MAVNKGKKLRGFDRALGRVVASKRALRGVSQAELSQGSGVALSLVGRIEAGTRSVTVAELETFADILRIPAEEMAREALSVYGGIEKLRSEAAGTTDDLAKKRAQKDQGVTAADADRQFEEDRAAALGRDDEPDDEPDAT